MNKEEIIAILEKDAKSYWERAITTDLKTKYGVENYNYNMGKYEATKCALALITVGSYSIDKQGDMYKLDGDIPPVKPITPFQER